MSRNRIWLFIVPVVGALAGCRDQGPPTGAAARAGASAAAAADPERADEAEMAAFAARVPGLAGYHFEGAELVVSLTAAGRAEQAVPALAAVAARGSGTAHVRPARYTFAELRGWRNDWSDRILEVAGVSFVDLDEAANRLAVGVAQPGARGRVLELLRDSGVPAAALEFEAAGYARPQSLVEYAPYQYTAPSQGDSITSYRRPLEGGLKISYRHSSSAPDMATTCTLGFVAMLNGVRVAITAAHCSLRHWDGDNTTFFQSSPGASRYFGYEYSDPNGASCGFMSPNVCRNSDAAAIALEPDVPASVGYIVRPVGPPPVGISPYGIRVGSLVVDAASPRFQITASRTPVAGEPADKVGVTTGWTRGAVRRTCVDMPAGRPWSKLRCQTWADYSSTSGDSGGPVFVPLADGTAALLGMHWGTVVDGDQDYAVFSSVAQISKDLGSLQVMPGSSGGGGGGGPGDGGGDSGGGVCPPNCIT